MRYIVRDGLSGPRAYVFDTEHDQCVMSCTSRREADEVAEDLNAIASEGPQQVTVPLETFQRLKAFALDEEASARMLGQQALELSSARRDRESRVRAQRAQMTRTRANDIRVVLKALGVKF